jgi:hypothetical protein
MSAKNTKEPLDTTGMMIENGLTKAISKGKIAPTANVAAEVSAA